MDKKEKLLKQLEDVKKKIGDLELKQSKQITKLVLKHGLESFDLKTLDKEFKILKNKLIESESSTDIDAKKN